MSEDKEIAVMIKMGLITEQDKLERKLPKVLFTIEPSINDFGFDFSKPTKEAPEDGNLTEFKE